MFLEIKCDREIKSINIEFVDGDVVVRSEPKQSHPNPKPVVAKVEAPTQKTSEIEPTESKPRMMVSREDLVKNTTVLAKPIVATKKTATDGKAVQTIVDISSREPKVSDEMQEKF